MSEDSRSEKQELHELVERLPEAQVRSALRFLKYLSADEVLLSLLNAPNDDEPYTDQQRKRDTESEASIARGEGIPHEDILRESGL